MSSASRESSESVLAGLCRARISARDLAARSAAPRAPPPDVPASLFASLAAARSSRRRRRARSFSSSAACNMAMAVCTSVLGDSVRNIGLRCARAAGRSGRGEETGA